MIHFIFSRVFLKPNAGDIFTALMSDGEILQLQLIDSEDTECRIIGRGRHAWLEDVEAILIERREY
jgi:hypothetical protein